MFVPAVVAGTLLSITFWIIAMLLLRTYGLIRNKIFSNESRADDVEMCNSKYSKNKSNTSKTIHENGGSIISNNGFHHQMTAYNRHPGDLSDCDCDTKQTKLLTIRNSHHSSPVSLSSGIGVSERDSCDDRVSEEREAEPGHHRDEPPDQGCDKHYCYCHCGKRWNKRMSETQDIDNSENQRNR